MRVTIRRRRLTRSRAAVVTALATSLVLVWSGVALAGFPEHATVTVPANGGNATVHTSPFPGTSTSGSITVAPKAVNESIADKAFQTILAEQPTKGLRLLHCVFMTFIDGQITLADNETTDDESGPNLQALFLLACIRVALSLPPPSAAHFAAAGTTAPSCGRADKAVAMTVTRVGSTWTVNVSGMTHAPTVASRARISCRLKGSGAAIGLRPRVRGKNLRWALSGSEIRIGYVNRTPNDVGVKMTFGVR